MNTRSIAAVLACAAALAWSAPAAADEGVLVGRVLSDASGLPLAGASVRVAGSSDPAVATDSEGRYSLDAAEGPVVLLFEKSGFTPAARAATAVAASGRVVLDARLTPLADPVHVGPAGATLRQDALAVTIPAGAVASSTPVVLTPLSAQGLPGRLPLGWTPVAAWDLRAEGDVNGTLPAALTGLSGGVRHLVRWDAQAREWRMEAPGLAVADGALETDLPGLGTYALLAADSTAQRIGFHRIHSIDAYQVALGYRGRPDLLLKTDRANVFQHIECRNITPGRPLDRKEQIVATIARAKQRARDGDRIDRDLLAGELSRLTYVFRGAENRHPTLRREFMDVLREALAPFNDLTHKVTVTFDAGTVPF